MPVELTWNYRTSRLRLLVFIGPRADISCPSIALFKKFPALGLPNEELETSPA